MQVASIKMDGFYSGSFDPAKLESCCGVADSLECLVIDSLAYAPKGEVRREGAVIFFVTEGCRARIDLALEVCQLAPGVDPDPKHADPLRVWERTEPADGQVELWDASCCPGEHLLHEFKVSGGHIAQEFQGQMHIPGGNPADRIIAQCLTQAGCVKFD